MGKQLVNKIRGKNLQTGVRSSLSLLGFFRKFRGENAMAKISAQRSSGINAWAKISLVILCAMLVSMFMVGGLCSPLMAEAANVSYYLQGDTTTNLGFDGIANLPAAQSTGTAIPYRGTMVNTPVTATSWRPTSLATGSQVLIRGYAPASGLPKDITSITGSYAIRNGSSADTWTFHAYDYNPTTGTKTQIATTNTITGVTAGVTTTVTPTYTISGGTYRIPANNRLVIEIVSNPSATSTGHRVYYGGTTATTGCWVVVNETLVGAPTVNWSAASQSSTNESGDLTVTAQLSATPTVDVTVPFTVTGTATNGTDYMLSATSITIPAGSTTGTATISITTDLIDETDETVILTMGTPTNANLGATTVHTATITDDDAYPTVSWSTATQASTNETGTMTVVAQLTTGSTSAITVPFTITGSATNGTDYTIPAPPITIPAGSLTGTAIINIIADALDESNEDVILTMGTPTNATAGTTTVHTATITDDDDALSTGVIYETPWTILGTGTTGTLSGTMALAKGAGTNRVLVVQVVAEYTTATTAFAPTVTYGGQTLTTIASTNTTSTNQKIWIGYLAETGIAAATGTPPAFVVTGWATPTAGCSLAAAFYSRVDQASPITGSRAVSSGTATTTPPSSPISVISGGYGIYGLNTNSNTAGTVTPPTGYYQPYSTINGSNLYQHTVGAGFQASTGTTDPLPTWTSVRYAYVTAALRPDAVNNFTSAKTASVTVAGKDRIQVEAPYGADANANNTLRVEYKLTTDGTYTLWQNLPHSNSPYSTLITGLTAGTSYDVRVTYLDSDTVNESSAPAVQVYTVITRAGGSVSMFQSWTNSIHDVTTRTVGTAVNLSGNYAVNAGTSRVLVVAITHTNSANVAPAAPSTIRWGGQNLTLATTNRGTSARQHTWLYYLKDNALMDGTSRPVELSWSGGIASTKIDVYCAVFDNVGQIGNYVVGTALNNTTATTAMQLSAAMTIPANALGVYVLNVYNVTNTTIPTWTANANWRSPLSDVDPSMFSGTFGTLAYADQLAQRALPLGITSDNAVTSTRTSTRYAMSALVLPPISTGISTGATAPNLNVYAGDKNKVVDAFTVNGSGSFTSIQITGNAYTTNSVVSAVRIYRKGDTNTTAYTAGVDTLIGSGTFGAVSAPVDIAVNETVSSTTNYIVVYDIADGAVADGTTIKVTGAVTAATPAPGSLSDNGATLTLYAKTILGTGTEPAAQRLTINSADTRLNAFTLVHNGSATDNDTVTNLTIRMTPKYITGGSGGTISKFKSIDGIKITDSTGTKVSTAEAVCSTSGVADGFDTCTIATNIPVTNIPDTNPLATYYVVVATAGVINPSVADTSGTPTGYYTFGGTVVGLSHLKATNQLVLGDSGSQTLTIDVEVPTGPSSPTAVPGTNGGEINVGWAEATDPHSGELDPTTPYLIRRSQPDGVLPAVKCIDGVDLATVPGVTINTVARTVTDKGLIDSSAVRYYYRICAKDALGNVSDGVGVYSNSQVTMICTIPPEISLTPSQQLIKSVNSTPFTLSVTNKDQGACPDTTYALSIVDEVGNSAHFNKVFPATVTVGTGSSGTGTPVGASADIIITGRPEAAQLETYKFRIQVDNATHGGPITTAQVTGLLNDMPPIVHNSANMGLDKYGQWGQSYTCATCHSNSTTNIKGIYTIISTPIGRRNVVFTKTSSVSTDSNGTFSTDQRAVRNVSNNVCSVCHHRTTQHQYSANKADLNYGNGLGVTGPNSDTAYTTDHHNARDCVRCHTHNTAFRSITGVCGDCHGNKITGYFPVSKATMVHDKVTNALGNGDQGYGAHATHNKSNITCGACHSVTNHGLDTTAWVGDRILEMGFEINKDTFQGFNQSVNIQGGTFYGTSFLSAPYTWFAGPGTTITPIADYNNSCSTYCHGNWAGNSGSATTPIWIGTGQSACGTCHNASGGAPPASGSHIKHAADFGSGLGIACSKCHGAYANFTGAAHVNGKVQWDLSAIAGSTPTYKGSTASSTNALAPTASIDFGTCTNLYCHSTVQGPDGTSAPEYKVAKWGDPTTATCGSCHVMPNNTGSHASHENAQVAFDCHVCHDTGGTTTALNHGNGTIDFKFVGLGQNTKYSGISTGSKLPRTGYGTCSTSDCHGRFTRAWGTAASALTMCDKCHGSATSPRGFYNTQGPDGTLSVYSTAVGVHDIHIQNLNSPRKSTFARYTSYATGYSCNQCHNTPSGPFSPGHVDTALPAEANFNNVSSIANRGIVFQYYSTPAYSRATQTCSAVWCHGAGMHSNRATDEYAGTTPPARSNPKWNVPFLTGSGVTDCTKCHALPPAAPNSSYTHFGKTLQSCASCHQHVSADGYGFKDKTLHVNGTVEGGCDGCHGNPPITAADGPPDGKAGQNAIDGAGAHNAHVLLPQIGNNCNTCHNAASPTMPSNNLEIGFNALGGQVTTGTFTGYTNSVNGPKWMVPSPSPGTTILKSNVKAAVCSNLYCHGGGSSNPVRAALGGGSNTTPNWEVPAVCGDCHGIDSSSAPSGGSHPRHALTVSSLSCESCHGVTNDNGTHVNGAVSWKLDRSNPVIGSGATYNNLSSGSIAGLAPHTSYQQCNNVYCHSTVQSGNGTGVPTYASPRWGSDNGTLGCSGCHKDMATDPAPTGSHLKHANPASGMNVPCGYCHQDGGDGSAIHADGQVFVNFTSYIGGLYSVGTPYLTGRQKVARSVAFGSCSATFCHGTADSPAWGTAGPLACNACHSAKADDVSWSGRHTTHYNSYTAPSSYTQTVQDLSTPTKYRFNCAHCHDDNVAKHSLKPASADSAARVFFGISSATPASSSKRGIYVAGTPQGATDNGFKFTAGSCNTSYCHSNGRGGAPKNTTLTWVTTPTAGSNCLYCHDGKRTSMTATGLSGKHDKHMNYSTNTFMGRGNGFNCSDCHAPVITNINNTTIADKGKHVNAVLNYSGAKALKRNYIPGSGSCSTYCHSNGNPNAVVFVSMTGSKLWTTGSATIITCNNCHGRSNSTGYPDYANGGASTATSNLHAGHMSGMTDTTACSDCHRKTAETAVPNRFRPYSTTHLSGGPNVVFNKTKSYIGNNANVAISGAQGWTVTCSNIVCHGQGAPVWGTSTTAHQCQKCHGSRTQAFTNFSAPQVAPGYGGTGTDTSLTKSAPTDPRVGAHQRHLTSNVVSAPVKCGECHVVVTAIRSANHWNYSTATLTFSGRATANGHTPTVSRTSGIMSCSNLNCHTGKYNSGTVASPFWNMTGLVKETGATVGDCVKCHQMPPSGYASHPAQLPNTNALSTIVASCQGCHGNISSSAMNVGNAFNDKSIHVNGVINSTMSCNGCHDYDSNGGTWGNVRNANYGGLNQGNGAHYKHIEYLKAKYGVTLNAATDTWSTPAFIRVCGTCHSINEGVDHTMGTPTNPRSITFGDNVSNPRNFGGTPLYNGASGFSSAVNPKSCSNTDCHYRTSPIWSTY